ncbi:unnamed protein product [Lactuca saligna]|uniref:RRM domain-containing protein n=1 Tax=Lactuca saligna TaxID=75948 RepID=A0AA35Z2L6_LACSI|nr:unnamed protein product [Lactuca saligna]
MATDGGWQEATNRRRRKTAAIGNQKSWNHAGVTTLFVSNIPHETRIESLKSFFTKYGEVVDVYVAAKKDVNKKSFAFVRFKATGDERRLEESLQGITFKERPLEINIARFARKSINSKGDKFTRNQNQYRRPHEHRWRGRDNRSFAEVVRGSNKLGRTTTYQTQAILLSPIKISDDSPLKGWLSSKLTLIGEIHSFDHLEKVPLAFKNCDGSECELKYLGGLRMGVKFIDDKSRDSFLVRWSKWFRLMESGDIATYNFERIAWIKIIGLPPKLWSEENFSKITGLMGRVIVPFEVDTSSANLVYGNVVDLDWTPFKQLDHSLEDTSSSDEDEDEVDDLVGSDDEDHVSDTPPMQYEKEESEEGEIREEDGTEINSHLHVAGKHNNSEMRPPPAIMVPAGTDGGSETELHWESQRAQINANVNEPTVIGKSNGNAGNIAPSKNLESTNLGHMDLSNGPLNALPLTGCFGPFHNNMVRSEPIPGRTNNNFKGSSDKRR